METSWRDRKHSLDITALDAAVKAVIDIDLPNGKTPKIMKRHYKENFVRYDIGIGTVGHKDAESYEKTVAEPIFDTIKERAVKKGWTAFYQPSYGSRGSVAWMDYYVQLRIPYDNTTTIQEGTCMNSIYERMNKIDDSKSLSERWNVKSQREPKKLKESGTSSDRRKLSKNDIIYRYNFGLPMSEEDISKIGTVEQHEENAKRIHDAVLAIKQWDPSISVSRKKDWTSMSLILRRGAESELTEEEKDELKAAISKVTNFKDVTVYGGDNYLRCDGFVSIGPDVREFINK